MLFVGAAIAVSLIRGQYAPSLSHETTANRHVMWQNMPVIALLNGFYSGRVSVQQVKEHGDFGLGAFANLDGEVVILDATVYQITADGRVHKPDASALPSYALVTQFHPDSRVSLPARTSFTTLMDAMERKIATINCFYAIRLTGSFSSLEMRSVRNQNPPYPPFCEVQKTQAVFRFSGVSGTMAGFIGPAYLSTADTPGLHLHFLTKDGSGGGHVLSFSSANVTAEFERIDEMQMKFPRDAAFDKASLNAIATCR